MTKEQKEKKKKPKEEKKTLSIAELTQKQLEERTKEAKEFKDKYYRLLAESENMKKRMQKERTEMLAFAVDNAIISFLSPLDQFKKALEFASEGGDEVRNWAIGFEMIQKQFDEALSASGITPFTSLGEVFDPHRHDAIEMVETSDHPNNTIIEEIEVGYLNQDRLVRPSKVKVAITPKESENEDQPQSEKDLEKNIKEK